jgi:hypothetical protein
LLEIDLFSGPPLSVMYLSVSKILMSSQFGPIFWSVSEIGRVDSYGSFGNSFFVCCDHFVGQCYNMFSTVVVIHVVELKKVT